MATEASSSSNGWTSIRPWQPPLSLALREVTSVSVTFILSSNISNLNEDLDSSLDLTEDGEPQAESSIGEEEIKGKSKRIIQEVLDRGMSVKVNAAPWQRVFIRIDDAADEAVIIIYGLMPGRHYDVDLELFQGDSSIRRQVITEDAIIEPEPVEESTDPESSSFGHSSSDRQSSSPSTSPNRTNPNTPPTVTIQLSPDERLAQLQHTLSLLNTEREDLTVSLKAARRDNQKADASLRSEIEILKRASEKHSAAEHKAKQRMLSVQEAVKRAQTATKETEEAIKEVEEQLPEINRQKAQKEAEHTKVKAEADKVRKEKDRMLEKEKKRIDAMKAELTSLTNKVEKLNAKKEKLETTTLVDLEDQLKDIGREIEEVDNQVYMDPQDLLIEDYLLSSQAIPDNSFGYPYIPTQRIRAQASPTTLSRPPPIQRPVPSDSPAAQWTAAATAASRQSTAPSHQPRSTSLNSQGHITILQNPNRQPPLKASSSGGSSSGSHTSSSSTSAQLKNTTSVSTTLSSKAPAFEPGKPLKIVTGAGQGPIQRPGAGGPRNSGFSNHTKAKSTPHGPWDRPKNGGEDQRN